MTFSKKHTAIPLSIIIICIIARGFFLYYISAYPLASLCKELAMDTLENNPLELHFSIAYPEEMGLKDISADLIPYHAEYYKSASNAWTGYQETLSGIAAANLKDEDAFLYNLLENHINLQLKSLEFPYYENPLSCSGGVHSQLPILLAEYALRSKEDIENYFTLLSQIPAYLEGIALYAADQELNGIAQYERNISEVRTQCLTLFPQTALENNSHFLQTGFHDRLQALVEENILTEAEAADYELRNTASLKSQLAPAYEALASSLGNLRGTAELTGLAGLPKGKSYYELLLAANTGSDRTVQEIQSMLYDRYDRLYNAYTSLLTKNNFLQNWDFPLGTHSDMITHLYENAKESFPPLELLKKDTTQQVRLKKVDGILAGMSAPAFYMTPPIDANDEHTIYINPDADMEPLDLYTTLAHEGFPGHLYQTAYSQTALTEARVPLIRQLLYYGGFTEGWAVYAELYCYNFLMQTCEEALQDTLLLNRLNREIQLCLCSILDVFIHYEGATLGDVETLLTNLGLGSSSAAAVYSAICDAPANYPKYYVGYLEILDLQNTAKELWGENYSDYTFHKWLLETGGGDFGSLRECLENAAVPKT